MRYVGRAINNELDGPAADPSGPAGGKEALLEHPHVGRVRSNVLVDVLVELPAAPRVV